MLKQHFGLLIRWTLRFPKHCITFLKKIPRTTWGKEIWYYCYRSSTQAPSVFCTQNCIVNHRMQNINNSSVNSWNWLGIFQDYIISRKTNSKFYQPNCLHVLVFCQNKIGGNWEFCFSFFRATMRWTIMYSILGMEVDV